jgi:hypothetical protein
MAHGGTPEWNASIQAAVAPLAERVPTAVAFGMADPATLAAGLDSLRSEGVARVAVVRMYVSGRSFREQTDYFLGLSTEAPGRFVLMGHGGHAPTDDPRPIEHGLEVATHDDGLMQSPEAARIVRERFATMSVDPASESVLLLAHGMGADGENAEVVSAMEAIMAGIPEPWAASRVATLREDWAEPRAEAEDEIRSFVAREAEVGRRVLVVPMRLSGFGPYADVLAGLDYRAGEGLLPHGQIGGWVEATATRIVCAEGWPNPMGRCPVSIGDPSPTAPR